MSILLFASDLHIPQHQIRYNKILPYLKDIDDICLVYFPLPYFVHLLPSQPDILQLLLHKLRTVEGLALLCQIPDQMQQLFDDSMTRICPSSAITEHILQEVVNHLSACSLPDLVGWRWRGLDVYTKAQRDCSICIKKNLEDLDSSGSVHHISFIKLTMISIALSLEIVHSILQLRPQYKPGAVHKCIVPDAYSAFLAIGDYCKSMCVDTMILTSDAHFLELLKISPLDPHPQNIAAHNVQFLCHEYVSPPVYFNVSKVYIRQKVIDGQSSQAYSTGYSDQSSLQDISRFISRQVKTLVYYTSSPDEQFGNLELYPDRLLQNGLLSRGVRLFADEYQMIIDLCSFARSNGYGLIVRLHPRLGSESRCAEVSTARNVFMDLLSSLRYDFDNSILIIPPEMPVSSYWLGAQGSVNIFFRSSIGLELAMLGFPAISPNHLDSYTYQGMGYETSDLPTTIDSWHEMINRVSESGFAYYVHSAVRGFYMQRFSSTFTIENSNLSRKTTHGCEHDLTYAFPSIDRSVLVEFLQASSSFALPQLRGYWPLSDYIEPWKDYMRWLKHYAYPKLGISRETSRRKLFVQANMFLNSLP